MMRDLSVQPTAPGHPVDAGDLSLPLPGGLGKAKAALAVGNGTFQSHRPQRLLTLDGVYLQVQGTPYLSRV